MKVLMLVWLILVAGSVAAQKEMIIAGKTDTIAKQKDINAVIEFMNAEYDFGKIPMGKPVEYDLRMKNISKDTVTIQLVQVSCGCTTPKWIPGKKYAPGEVFSVTLGFNAATKGMFMKTATLTFNGGLVRTVVFKGEVYEGKGN